jgi:hypothetical protein
MLTMQPYTKWQETKIFTAMATPHRPADENMADDDDESFDDEMQDEEDLYELRTQDDDSPMAPGDDDHLPDDDLQ